MNSNKKFKQKVMSFKILDFVRVSFFILLCTMLPSLAFGAPDETSVLEQQQTVSIRGTVKDLNGDALIGANVAEKGTSNGISTDVDGNYTLSVSPNATIEINYLGYVPQSFKVTSGKTVYDVILSEDSQSLDEVVVMGYGVQKKKLVTGATVQVTGDDIQKMATTNVFAAIQSMMPGVLIQANSGRPGDDYKVRIRGIGTNGDSNPLYVVDGIPSGSSSSALSNLNPSDIESIDVLKDAASAAIYGSRAANGVILITTKKGTDSKVTINYDGFFGLQTISKFANTLDAKQYMALQDERVVNEGQPPFDWSKQIPQYLVDRINNGTWKGSDWQREAYNEAPSQNHSLGILGGNANTKFALGFSYNNQKAVLGDPQVHPDYTRYTFRINTSYVALKSKGRDVITLGENLNFNFTSNRNSTGGAGRGSMISNLMRSSPLMPVRDKDGNYYDQDDKSAEGWVLQGSLSNPFVILTSTESAGTNLSLNVSPYLEIQPIAGLTFRSVFGYRQNFNQDRNLQMVYKASTTTQRNTDQISQSASGGYSVSLSNTLNYIFSLKNRHSVDVLFGQEIEMGGFGQSLNGTSLHARFPNDFDRAFLNNADPTVFSDRMNGGSPNSQSRNSSFLGRVNYNYNETYLASLVMRADGSSNFAKGKRWGYFPSASVGWVLTNEEFASTWRDKGINYLKLRASWGQTGNSRISNFQYSSTYTIGGATSSYFFGNDKQTIYPGAYPDILPNVNVTWETSEQTNIGLDARFLRSRLGLVLEWYRKDTKDWLITAPQLASFGTGSPSVNAGSVRNQGLEFSTNWNDRIGALSYRLQLSGTYLKNEVLTIENSEGIIHGGANVLSQGTTEMNRVEIGQPMGYFWGFKTLGVFQNQAEIDAYRATGKGLLNNAQPGDLIFYDKNGDGTISDLDKLKLGHYLPDFTGSFSVNLGYKGFDFSVTAWGNFGMQIAKSYRDFADSPFQNFTDDILGRWHGEGTSNRLPRLTAGSHANWQYVSDIYIQDADFVKISNIRLGYDFKRLFKKLPFGKATMFATIQNLCTFTGYDGMDPEVSYGNASWAGGIDLGFYPQQRTYQLGISLSY